MFLLSKVFVYFLQKIQNLKKIYNMSFHSNWNWNIGILVFIFLEVNLAEQFFSIAAEIILQ